MDKVKIAEVIEGLLTQRELFLVDIEVSKDNDILVTVESKESVVKIENCIEITRVIEGVFDREIEDYSLTVSSAGLDQSFKVLEQYQKYENTEVEIAIKGAGKLKGILKDVSTNGFNLLTSKMVKREGAKKKELEEISTYYDYSSIKSCKPIIKFK